MCGSVREPKRRSRESAGKERHKACKRKYQREKSEEGRDKLRDDRHGQSLPQSNVSKRTHCAHAVRSAEERAIVRFVPHRHIHTEVDHTQNANGYNRRNKERADPITILVKPRQDHCY